MLLNINQEIIKKDISDDLLTIPVEFLRDVWINDLRIAAEKRKSKKS